MQCKQSCAGEGAAMVLKTTTCRFSGLRIYPGRGILFVRTDGQQYLFINRKTKSLFGQRKRPAKIAWTTTYRKQHKKVGSRRNAWPALFSGLRRLEALRIHASFDRPANVQG